MHNGSAFAATPAGRARQANELLSLKPTLAKKLNDRIKSLQAEIEVLRSDTKVNELERKVAVRSMRGRAPESEDDGPEE
eukprot:351398-Chlamydomonas_euryale.AAC.3